MLESTAPHRQKPLAIYVHWPFCKSKCPYCDFNSHVATRVDHADWQKAYQREIAHYADVLPDRLVTSIFFGGGTPSLMAPETVSAVINDIARHWTVARDVEITLEANPTSSEVNRFKEFRAAGVNRVSLGVQALRDDDLKFLGREHSALEARHALQMVQSVFPRHSFDLIYARRGQSVKAWEEELREALAIAKNHLSLYQLTIEASTQFYTRHQRGESLTAPDEDAATMFEMTQAIMESEGLPAYEISNHARPGDESRHNMTYWHYEDYVGIGPGAHGRYRTTDQRWATDNHRTPDKWLGEVALLGQGRRQSEELDAPTAMREALMMGLRLRDGIDQGRWFAKFGTHLNDFLSPRKRAKLCEDGFLHHTNERLAATAAGRQRLNGVINYLMD